MTLNKSVFDSDWVKYGYKRPVKSSGECKKHQVSLAGKTWMVNDTKRNQYLLQNHYNTEEMKREEVEPGKLVCDPKITLSND